MFSLIITIISIALVAVLAMATLYYGGTAFTKGAASATAAKVMLQGQQLLGAAELYKAEHNEWPASVEVLVSENYLKSIPLARGPISAAVAADVAWVMPVSGVPVFVLEGVEPAPCTGVNMKAYGVEGVLKTLRTEYQFQCFGLTSNVLKVVVGKTSADLIRAASDLAATVALGVVSSLPAPVDPSSSEWLVLDAPAEATPPATPQETFTGALTPDTSIDFGTVAVGSSASRSFTFRNSGNSTITGVYADVSAFSGLSLTANSCGTSGNPVSVSANSTCQVTLNWRPTEASSLNGARLTVSGAYSGAPSFVALAGSDGTFDSAGAWSTANSSLVAPSDALKNFGTLTTSSASLARFFYLLNTGTNGAMNNGFTLSGDTNHFKITQVNAISSNAYSSGVACGTLTSNGLATASNCLTQNIKGGSQPTSHIRLLVTYAPSLIGKHSVTLTPSSSNGAVMPEPLTLTGTGEFNPTGTWSTVNNTNTTPTAALLNFGMLTSPGGSVGKNFFLRNTGTNGALSSGFTLTGDTAHFKITQIAAVDTSYSAISCGVVGSNGLSTTSNCMATDVKGGTQPHIKVYVTYAPTSKGNHSVTLTPTGGNGSVMPAPLTLTGTGQ